jgi:lipid-binding SYLF domain-containing protein
MKRASSLILAVLFPLLASAQKAENQQVANAGKVLSEVLNIPDDIPRDLLDKAECVIVIPSVKKLASGIGGDYGRGAMVCRTGEKFRGPWGAPAMYALEGGSFGFQIGGESTDLILLVMNDRGMESILSSKVKLGADASVAGGPKGRDASASTDVWMRAEILSYSRSRGLFAGISLEGSTLRPDNDANKNLYGKEIEAKDILLKGAVHPPASAKQLLSILNRESPGSEGGTKGVKPRKESPGAEGGTKPAKPPKQD